MKNVWSLLGALAAAYILQLAAAFAFMIPATLIRQFQIMSTGISSTAEEEMIMYQLVSDLTEPILLTTHILILVSFALWYGLGCCKDRNAAFGLKKAFGGRNILIIGILAVGSCYLTNFAMPIVSTVIPEDIVQSYVDMMASAEYGESILNTITALLIAPFGEEFLFRGVIYYYACNLSSGMKSKKVAFYAANIMQALAFGMFHGNIIQGTYAFFFGLILGYTKERFGTIWASIAAHMMVNVFSTFLWEPIVLLLPETYTVYLIGTVVCALIVVIGFKLSGPAVGAGED